jgi:hypothetical protein
LKLLSNFNIVDGCVFLAVLFVFSNFLVHHDEVFDSKRKTKEEHHSKPDSIRRRLVGFDVAWLENENRAEEKKEDEAKDEQEDKKPPLFFLHRETKHLRTEDDENHGEHNSRKGGNKDVLPFIQMKVGVWRNREGQ